MSKKVLIMSDSGCSLTPDELKKYDVVRFPFGITTPEGEALWDDGKTIGLEQVYSAAAEGKMYQTSCCSMGEVREGIEKALKTYDSILFIAFAKGMSSQYSYVKELEKEFPNFYCADICGAAGAQDDAIYLAREKLDAGESVEEVLKYVESLHKYSVMLMLLRDLTGVTLSGRIPKTLVKVLKFAKVTPLLRVSSKIESAGLINNGSDVAEKFVAKFESFWGQKISGTIQRIIINHTYDDEIDKMKAIVKTIADAFAFPFDQVIFKNAPVPVAMHAQHNAMSVYIRSSLPMKEHVGLLSRFK